MLFITCQLLLILFYLTSLLILFLILPFPSASYFIFCPVLRSTASTLSIINHTFSTSTVWLILLIFVYCFLSSSFTSYCVPSGLRYLVHLLPLHDFFCCSCSYNIFTILFYLKKQSYFLLLIFSL